MLKIGKIVRHPSKPGWGNGKVIGIDDNEVEIVFSDAGIKTLRYKEASVPLIEIMDQRFIEFLNPCLGFYKSTTNFCETVTKDDFTYELLKIKNRDKDAIRKYALQAQDILNHRVYQKYLKDSIICTVPSSTKGNTNTGITQFAKFLLKDSTFIDGVHLLVRSESLPKNSKSDHRASREDHLRTILIERESVIRNKTIFLIDDIRTTGISLESCKSLLENKGAAEVITMSLGKTVYKNDYINNPDHPARAKQSVYFQRKLVSLGKVKITAEHTAPK